MVQGIGAISDIHGSASALRAVFAWLDEQGVSEIVCAGDIAGFGPNPNECISMLAERRVRTILGNSDRDLLCPKPLARHSRRSLEIAEIESWVRNQLSAESLSYLRGLPYSLTVEDEVLVVHGAPDDMDCIVGPEDTPPIPCGVDVVVAGHLHVPFVTHAPNGTWVNVGSVCSPCDGDPRPAVSVLSKSHGQWAVSQHRVDFDARVSARDILKSGMPHAESVASAVLAARWYRSQGDPESS